MNSFEISSFEMINNIPPFDNSFENQISLKYLCYFTKKMISNFNHLKIVYLFQRLFCQNSTRLGKLESF